MKNKFEAKQRQLVILSITETLFYLFLLLSLLTVLTTP